MTAKRSPIMMSGAPGAAAVIMASRAVDEQGVSAFQMPIIFPLLWMAKRLTHRHHPRVGSTPHMPFMPPLASRLKSIVSIKEKNDNIDSLVDWLDEMDGSLSSVKVDSNSQGLRGLYATKDLRSGEIVVEIPYDAALLVGDTLWGTIFDDFDDIQGSDEWDSEDLDDVYQGLNFLQTFNKDIDFEPYISNLPPIPSSGDEAGLTPDFWSKEFILGFEVPSFIKTILERKQIVQEVAKKNNVHEDELRWATWMMRSRRFTTWNMVNDPDMGNDEALFGVFPMRRKQIEQIQGFLLPLIDMANHAHDPNAVLKISVNRWTREFDDTSTFALRALKPIKKGEEVTISYGDGDRTSLDLLDKYGFFLEGNEADMIELDWDELSPEFTTSLEEDKAELAMLEGSSQESKTRVKDKLKTIVSKIQDYEPNFASNIDGLDLVGSGMRQKMGIKIYAVALYGSPAALGAESSYDLRNAARTFNQAAPRTTFVLEMILQADANTIADAIATSVKLRYDGPHADIQYLEALIQEGVKDRGGQSSKGCSLQFDCTEKGVSVIVDGVAQGTAGTSNLGSAFVDVFLDENTVSPSLIDNCLRKEVHGLEAGSAKVSNVMSDQQAQASRRSMLSLRVLMKQLSGLKPTAMTPQITLNEAVANGGPELQEEVVGSESPGSSEISGEVIDETDTLITETLPNGDIEMSASVEDAEFSEPELVIDETDTEPLEPESVIDETDKVIAETLPNADIEMSARVDEDAEFSEPELVIDETDTEPLEPESVPDDEVLLVEPNDVKEEIQVGSASTEELDKETRAVPVNTDDTSSFDTTAVEARIRQLEAEIQAEIARVQSQDTQPPAASGGAQDATPATTAPAFDSGNGDPVEIAEVDEAAALEEEARLKMEEEERQKEEKAAAEANQRYEAVEGKAKSLKEKATGVLFDPKLDDTFLVGVGVRKKAIINVYAVACYSSPSTMEALAPFPRGKQKKEAQMALLNAARTFDSSTPTTTFVLEMVFKADGATIAGAISDGVKPRYGGPATDVKELESLIINGVKSKGGQATKGTVFRFDCTKNGVSVSVDGNEQGVASFNGLGSALVGVFLDEKAVSPQLIESCLDTWCGSGL